MKNYIKNKHLLCSFVIKKLKIPCFGTEKIIFVIFFDIENFSLSNFGTNSLLLKIRIDWYIKLSFI